jgi:succinate dehydrogenase / fumarate reductase cytochrome b subunit
MGASGLMLVGFAVAHLLGNLLIFFGPDALNAYAQKLEHLGVLLWAARISLLAAAAAHIATGIQLAHENRAARPIGYRKQQSLSTTWAAKTMALSGALLLAYIIYHLLHFTFGVTHPSAANLTDHLGRHDVYSMVVLGFQDLPVSIGYILAMGLLSSHLAHGIASMFQSIGLTDERARPALEGASRLIALGLFIGYSSIPLAVMLGIVRLGAGGGP